MNLKKTILALFLIQTLAVAGNRVFAQNCDHWLKIVRTDKDIGGIFVISDNNGNRLQSINIPYGTDAATAAGIINQQISVHRVLFCFSRVGPYLRVNDINIHNFKFINVGQPAGFKLQEVTRPNFVSKVDSITVTANRQTEWKTDVIKINSDTEMYDGFTVDPVSYAPKEPPFGHPTERKTDFWEYKAEVDEDIYKVPTEVELRCAISKADAFITVKLKVKKLVLSE